MPGGVDVWASQRTVGEDGKDYALRTVKCVCKDGNLCPLDANFISVKVKGAGYYRAGANGDPTSLESFQAPGMKVFSGMMTAIVSPTETPGEIILEATAQALKKASVRIESKDPGKDGGQIKFANQH